MKAYEFWVTDEIGNSEVVSSVGVDEEDAREKLLQSGISDRDVFLETPEHEAMRRSLVKQMTEIIRKSGAGLVCERRTDTPERLPNGNLKISKVLGSRLVFEIPEGRLVAQLEAEQQPKKN